jgi:hypothetical protein
MVALWVVLKVDQMVVWKADEMDEPKAVLLVVQMVVV